MNKITKEVIEKSIIIFDTSALIELYYFPEEILEIIENNLLKVFNGQFWLPYQVYLEYEEKREEKKNVPSNTYNSLLENSGQNNYISQIENVSDKIVSLFKTTEEYCGKMDKHPFISKNLLDNLKITIDSTNAQIKAAIEPIKNEINTKIDEFNKKDDKVKQLLDKYFKIGRKYTFSEKLEIAEEGQGRYELQIPPGWADGEGKTAKTGLRKFNDLFIWKQSCEISLDQSKDIIIITKDYGKEDWCIRTAKSSFIDAPKSELLDELEEKSGKYLRMFSLIQFLEYSAKELDFDLDPMKLIISVPKEKFSIKEIKAGNKSDNIWGVSQVVDGKAYVSEKEIRVHISRLILCNENGLDWFISTISVNIAYTNENGRWDILRAGERFKTDVELLNKGDTYDLINIDLTVNREDINTLEGLWLVFQIDTYNDGRKSYGTMYNHWKGVL